jgi:hypothetical protein
VRPYLEKDPSHNKRASGVAQAVEQLPSKYEAVSSNPRPQKKKKKKDKRSQV